MDQDQQDRLLHYLNFPAEMAKAEKDSLRKRSKNFLVKNGLLYYQKKNVDLQVRVQGSPYIGDYRSVLSVMNNSCTSQEKQVWKAVTQVNQVVGNLL